MTMLHAWHLLSLIMLCLMVHRLPARHQADAIALGSALFLLVADIWAAVLLVVSSAIVYRLARRRTAKSAIIAGVTTLGSAFVAYKGLSGWLASNAELHLPVLLGLSYVVCRHIHFLFEALKGRVDDVSFRAFLQYQFFLPVLLAGPIHRIRNFQAQALRRRLCVVQLQRGLERALYGYVKVLIIGGYLLNLKMGLWIDASGVDGVLRAWLFSARDWLCLYAQFSGYSDIAIGFALALGYRIEENFNAPLQAHNLLDFWQRWHMSLSSWCKDYVFTPIAAACRSRFLAMLAAMLAMGAWHEVSTYYLVWGLYHALGIAVCRVLIDSCDKGGLVSLPARGRSAVMRVQAWGWLISGPPIIGMLAGR